MVLVVVVLRLVVAVLVLVVDFVVGGTFETVVDIKVTVVEGKVKSIDTAGIVVRPKDINSAFASSILSSAILTI